MGESAASTDAAQAYVEFSRTPYLVVSREQAKRKEVYGSIDDFVARQAQLLRGHADSDTVFVAMHPIGSPGYLPAFSHLARRGHHVIACGTRYSVGDAGLQMENALVDLAECVRDARSRLGYKKVVLVGWSGGGSLMAGFQAEAEQRVITHTAAGEETVLTDTELIPAEGLVLMAAHRSRHHLITDFIDPSILDEDRPDDRDPELDIYNPDNANKAPFSAEFLARYRAAQVARNERITARVVNRLSSYASSGRPDDEYCFVVPGTMADPRWLDATIDRNDRVPGTSYLGDPRLANNSPAGLARFTALRSWLSQWSLQHAQVDAVDAAPRITVPTLTLVAAKDDACPPSHSIDFHAAVASSSKDIHTVEGANHYFSGTGGRAQLDDAVDHIELWVDKNDLER